MSQSLRLSVLDQSPVPAGSTPRDALQNSIALARHVESLGFHRFWMSEHHAMDTLACTAPEIMLARIGAATSHIRLGSGGIMLPHYSPLKVAETFRTLHALYPDRIDLGIGRAPGGGPIESAALRRNRTAPQQDDFPDQLSELLHYLYPVIDPFPANHPFARIRVAPDAPGAPDVWLLGSSLWSATTAAQYGLPYAFAHFFSGESTYEAISLYQHQFTPSAFRSTPEATAAVGVICAETQDEADYLHASVRLLQHRIRRGDRSPIAAPEDALRELRALGLEPVPSGRGAFASEPFAPDPFARSSEGPTWPRYFVGTPKRIHAELSAMATTLHLNELIVNTITHSPSARLRSYTLMAQTFLQKPEPDETLALKALSEA